MIKIVLFLVWVFASWIEGRRDSFYFHNKMTASDPDKKNIHWLFSLERAVILSLICWVHSLSYSALNTGVFALSMIFIFSFIHNGEYYSNRNNLNKNIYKKRWWDSSTTSESIFEFNAVARTFLALVGSVGIIASFTFK